MNNLEPGSRAEGFAEMLRQIADFLDQHPLMAEGRTLIETVIAADEAINDLALLAEGDPDDFE